MLLLSGSIRLKSLPKVKSEHSVHYEQKRFLYLIIVIPIPCNNALYPIPSEG